MTQTRCTTAKIATALGAAKSAGLDVVRFTVARDGAVTVETRSATAAESVATPSDNVQPMRPKQWAKR